MFPPLGCRRGFPREPGPRWTRPPPPRPHGSWVVRNEPPWEPQHGRGRGRWQPPRPPAPGPFPGHDDFPWNEEDGRWAPRDCPPPPHWGDWEDNQRPEDFEESWYPDPMMPGPGCSDWPEFPDEEQHPPWPPPSMPGKRGAFQPGCQSWGYHDPGGRRSRRLRRGHRELTVVQRVEYPRSSRGNRQSSRSSSSLAGKSQPGVKKDPPPPDPPKPLVSCKDGAESSERAAQDPAAVSGEEPEPPSTPRQSPAADPQAAPAAAEPEPAGGATLVELGARQKPAGSHSRGPSALETEPAPSVQGLFDQPEKSSAGTGEDLEVEPSSQSVPKAGEDARSRPHSPTASLEPVERVHTTAGSTGEEGAELCTSPRGQQHPSGAGEAEAEAASDEVGLSASLAAPWRVTLPSKSPLRPRLQPPHGFQPSKDSQVPPGAASEPDAQLSQSCSNVRTVPETSPGTQLPPGPSQTEPAAGGQHRLCSALPTPSPASTDLRAAAVLARKEEIEQSYQQFSLAIAVVATMLLQKEPSMEALLGPALRANLRQGRIHHLRELEDFIDRYDSTTLSH